MNKPPRLDRNPKRNKNPTEPPCVCLSHGGSATWKHLSNPDLLDQWGPVTSLPLADVNKFSQNSCCGGFLRAHRHQGSLTGLSATPNNARPCCALLAAAHKAAISFFSRAAVTLRKRHAFSAGGWVVLPQVQVAQPSPQPPQTEHWPSPRS
jgi:hypothetical protein